MRRIVILLCFTITISLGVTSPVMGDEPEGTGNTFLTDCNIALRLLNNIKLSWSLDSKDWFSVGFCMGAIHGVQDTLRSTEGMCLPDEIVVGQAIRIVVKYLEDHPQELQEQDTLLIKKALLDAYPCN